MDILDIGRVGSYVYPLNNNAGVDVSDVRFCNRCGKSMQDIRSRICSKCQNAAKRSYEIRYPELGLLKKARRRAKASGLECTISRKDIVIPDRCPVLGIPLAKTYGAVSHGSPSIDRTDNSRGYVPGNIKVISYRANTLKNNATVDELRRIVRYIDGHS